MELKRISIEDQFIIVLFQVDDLITTALNITDTTNGKD